MYTAREIDFENRNRFGYIWLFISPQEVRKPEATQLSISTKTCKMEDDGAGGIDTVVTEYNNYEDFLDSQITPLDLYYLEVRINI